jgi:uncharacterized SAM-dependent methyltransferase
MWVDCVLCEATVEETDEGERLVPGRIVSKIGQPIYRESFRGNFFFNLDETLEPGDYFLINADQRNPALRDFAARNCFPGSPAAHAPRRFACSSKSGIARVMPR